jgi:hypothetical protein
MRIGIYMRLAGSHTFLQTIRIYTYTTTNLEPGLQILLELLCVYTIWASSVLTARQIKVQRPGFGSNLWK